MAGRAANTGSDDEDDEGVGSGAVDGSILVGSASIYGATAVATVVAIERCLH